MNHKKSLLKHHSPSLSKEEKELFANLADWKWRVRNLYYIKDKFGKKVLFKPNFAQEILMENLWFFSIVLKARQLGVTTFFCILFLDQVLFNSNKTAGIIAHKQDDAKKFFNDKVKFAWDNLPQVLKDRLGPPNTDSVGEMSFPNGSKIFVSTSVRGGTLQFLHCLHPDTGIFGINGDIFKVKNLKVGEKIISGKGTIVNVKDILKKKTTEKMLEIEHFGYYEPLRVTEEHKVLTREYKTGKQVWKKAKEIKKGDYLAFPTTEFSQKGKKDYTFKLGRLCGLYLAEGSLRRTEITFSLHQNEIEEVLGWLDDFKGEYKSRRVYYSKTSKTATITINQWKRSQWLEERFGSGVDKKISNTIFSYNSSFVKGLVWGMFYGDGSFTDPYTVSFCGARRNLVEQLRRLIVSLRLGVPSVYFSPAGYKYGRNCKDIWTLKLGGSGNWKFRKWYELPLPEYNTKSAKYRLEHNRCPTERKLWRRGKDVYWMRVKGVKEIEFNDFVYDIVLDKEPHSFLTTSGVVHNCSEFGKICAIYPKKAQEIVTGSINAVEQGNFVTIESTAEGTEGYFYQFCQEAQKMQKEGRELTPLDFKFFFFPWWKNPEYKLDSDNIVITKEDDEYFNTLRDKHGILLTLAQKRWYVSKKKMNLDSMFREYPSLPEEAFSVSIEGAYYTNQLSKVYNDKRIRAVPYDSTLPVETWWDLGVNDENVILFTQRFGNEIRFIDMYVNHGEGLAHYVNILKDKGYVYGRHVFPHDINVKSLNDGMSRRKTLIDLGMTNIHTVKRTDNVNDDIEGVRRLFSRFYFDETKCKPLVDALASYRKEWDDRLGRWKDRPRHDRNSHIVDPLRLMPHAWQNHNIVDVDEDDIYSDFF